MIFRLTLALYAFLLTACTSSEPQNVSYAPLAATTSQMQTAPLAPPSLPAAVSASTSTSLPVPATASMSALPEEPSAPSAYDQTIPGDEAATEAAVPAGATNCSTVDDVTLCDAPSDPIVDSSHYTN